MTSNEDRARWQVQTVKYLAELVALGGKHDLPPLYWSTGAADLSVVHGTPLLQVGKDRQRAFEQWCDLLQVVPAVRVTDDGYCQRFRAVALDVDPDERISVVLEADVWKD